MCVYSTKSVQFLVLHHGESFVCTDTHIHTHAQAVAPRVAETQVATTRCQQLQQVTATHCNELGGAYKPLRCKRRKRKQPHTHTHTHTHLHTLIHARTHTHTHTLYLSFCHTHTHTHIHAHTHSHTHTRTRRCAANSGNASSPNLMPATATTHCNTLQHTATNCNTLQHILTYCNTLGGEYKPLRCKWQTRK